jgi:predicted transcriptional regulator
MKVAVSIPDDIFAEAESLIKRSNVSRSQLYAKAVKQFVDRNDPDGITQTINDVLDEIGEDDELSNFSTAAGRRVLKRTEW